MVQFNFFSYPFFVAKIRKTTLGGYSRIFLPCLALPCICFIWTFTTELPNGNNYVQHSVPCQKIFLYVAGSIYFNRPCLPHDFSWESRKSRAISELKHTWGFWSCWGPAFPFSHATETLNSGVACWKFREGQMPF